MSLNHISPSSLISHVDARVDKVFTRFRLMPFYFFCEKEIHYEAYRELKGMRRDPRQKEVRIIREYPTSKLFTRENGLLKESKAGRRAFIDLVITHPSASIGFEFYLGRHTSEIELEYGGDVYFLRTRSLSPDEALTHTRNDCLKLGSENLTCSRVVLLIGAYHKTQSSKERFIEHKRSKIIKGLAKMRGKIPESIALHYIEQSYVGNLMDGELYERRW